jgi:hypothetical protein
MRSSISVRVVVLAVLAALVSVTGTEGIAAGVPGGGSRVSQGPPAAPPQVPVAPAIGAEDVVKALYRRVSFEAGKNVDWDQVKAMFIPEAVIVLRTSRTAMTVFNRDGFVRDFVRFITEAKLEDRAFEETILAIKTQETGEVARATVHYAARIPSAGQPAQQGIDVFLLMKKDGAWRIVSIVNEIVGPGVPVPEEVRK